MRLHANLVGAPRSYARASHGIQFATALAVSLLTVAITCRAAVSIATQPASAVVQPGQPAAFSVTATGAGSLTYQWRRNGVSIPGASLATYAIPAVEMGHADFYDVIVTDLDGPTTSAAVRLAVAPGTYGSTFELQPAFDLPVENANSTQINAVVSHGGNILVGGTFVRVNGSVLQRIARFNADGTLDTAFSASFGPMTLNALAVQPDNKVIVGGQFLVLNGAARSHLVRLDQTGLVDPGFDANVSGTEVCAVALQSDGKIVLAGGINLVNGTARTHIARVNADGSLDSSFNPAITGSDVRAVVIQADGRIVLGGTFTQVNGIARANIARLNADGSLDTSFNPGAGFNNTVRVLALDASQRVLVGGDFTTCDGTSAVRFARLATTGAIDSAFALAAGAGFDGTVHTLAVQADGKIVAGGSFSAYNGSGTSNVARIDPATAALDGGFAPGVVGTVKCSLVQADGAIVFGGGFSMVSGVATPRLCRVSSAGARDATLNAVFREPGTVTRIAPVAGGKWVLAGTFTHIGNTAVGNIARLNQDLTLDSTFNTGGSGTDFGVYGLAALPDGKLVIGGSFTSYNGSSANRLARLNSDGSLDTTYAVSGGPDAQVNGVTAAPGGAVMIAGPFTSYAGMSVPSGLARIIDSGLLDSTFDAGGAPLGITLGSGVALQPDGKLIVGGSFSAIKGVARNNLARLNADGSVDTAFLASGTGPAGSVSAVLVEPDGRVLVGGSFASFNGVAASRLVVLDSTGNVDSGYVNPALPSTPNTIVRQEDGKLLLFSGSVPRRFLASGASDTGFQVMGQTGANTGSYTAMQVLENGSILVGNAVIELGMKQRLGLMLLTPVVPPLVSTQPVNQTASVGDTVVFNITASGSVSNTYQWLRNGTPVAGGTSSTLTISGATPSDAGTYSVIVTNSLGYVISSSATLTGPAPAPTITTQPQSVTVTVGQPASMSVTASGAGTLTYQWRRNGMPISGATSTALSLSSARQSDADLYDVVVADGLSTVVSSPARLTVAPQKYPQGLRAGLDLLVEAEGGGIVTVVVPAASGQYYAGGDFLRVNGTPLRRLARFSTDGVLDGSFSPEFNGAVYCAAVQPDGKVVVGGSFNKVNGVSCGPLVRLTTSGTVDLSFAPSVSATVNAVALQPDGKVLVGGSFTSVASVTVNRIARINADGTRDTSWASGSTAGVNGTVNAIAIDGSGRVVVGGAFTQFGSGTGAPRVARLLSDGLPDATFAPGTGAENAVYAVAVMGDGSVYVGGSFAQFNGVSASRIVRLTPTGAVDSGFTCSAAANYSVNALALDGSGNLIIAGNFSGAGGASYLARVSGTGAVDSTFTPSLDGTVKSVFVHPGDGTIVFGGSFKKVGGIATMNLGRVADAGGARDARADVTFRGAGSVQRMIHAAGGKILIAGSFTHVTDMPVGNIARLNADLTLDSTFNPAGVGANGSISDLVQQPDGRILIGGNFTHYNGSGGASQALARLNEDGTLDASFNRKSVGGSVNAIAALSGGQALVGGSFSNYAGAANSAALVRIFANGERDLSFSLGNTTGATINTIAVQPDGRYMIGGSFSSINGVSRSNIARVGADGSPEFDAAFSVGTGANGVVRSILVQADGTIAVAGDFVDFGGVANPGLVLLRPDGSVAAAPAVGGRGMHALASQADGQMLVYGWTSFGGANYLARFDGTGAVDRSLYLYGSGGTPTTLNVNSSVLVLDDGSMLIPVVSMALNDQERNGLVHLVAAERPVITTVSPTSVRPGDTVTLTGTGFIDVQSVRFDAGSGVAATTFNVSPPTSMTLTVPLGAVSGPIRVETPYGNAAEVSVTVVPDFRLRNPGLTTSSYSGAAYGNGAYVLTSSSGEIFRSADGVAWARAYDGVDGRKLNAVAFGAGTFVAVGAQGLLLTSVDGQAWVPRNLFTTSAINGVACSGANWVAVGPGGFVATSSDAATWNTNSAGIDARSVAFGNGLYVAVGNAGAISKSADGVAWTSVSSGTIQALTGVGYLNGLFVATGSNGVLLTSPDAAVWTSRSSGTGNSLQPAMYGPAGYVVGVANTASVLKSADGSTWSTVSLPHGVFSAGVFGGSQYVVGATSGQIATSADLGTWTLRVSISNHDFRDVTYGNGRYVAVSPMGNGVVATSSDGVAWTVAQSAPGTGQYFNGVAYGNGRYVAVGSNPAAVYTSSDATTWSDAGLRTGQPLNAVAFGGGAFVAVGSGGVIYLSTTGTNWEAKTPVNGTGLQSVAYGSNRFVAVGVGGTIITSPDGSTWSAAVSSTTNSLNAVRFAGGKFVAVGNSGTITTSADGLAWANATSNSSQGLTGVAFGEGYYVAVGFGSTRLISTDAQTWTAATTRGNVTFLSGNPSVSFGNGRFVIAAGSGGLMSSEPPAGTLLIATQPESRVITAGETVTLTVSAAGSGLTYQWYEGPSGDTSHPVPGATGPSYTTPGLTASTGYWVRVTSGTDGIDSATAELLGGPVISTQPLSASVDDFTDVTFSVDGLGTGPISYQWHKDGAPVPGASAATYSLTPATMGSAGSYTVTLSNALGSVTSNPATLTVSPVGPQVRSHARSSFGNSLQSKSSAWLEADIGGTPPIHYQWMKNGVNIPGGSGTLADMPDGWGYLQHHVANWQAGDTATYSVALSSSYGPDVTSTPVPIVVGEEAGWSSNMPLPSVNLLTNVVVMNGQFLITGTRGIRILTTDGSTFTSLPPLWSNNEAFYAQGNGVHVLSATVGGYLTSTDGVNWTNRHLGRGDAGIAALQFGNGLFVAASDDGRVFRSTDAINWSECSVPVPTGWYLAFANGRFLALGQTAGSVLTSPDAVNWTLQGTLPPILSPRVRAANDRFLVSGDAGAVYESLDGIAWTARTIPTSEPIPRLSYGGGRYVAVTKSGATFVSTDLAAWTPGGTTVPFPGGSSEAMAYSNGTWMVVGGSYGAPLVHTSPDGMTWTNRAQQLTTSALMALANDGSSIVAVGGSGAIARSNNGSTWTLSPSGVMPPLNDVVSVTGDYIAVGGGGVIIRSVDAGATWSSVPSGTGQVLRHVGQHGVKLVATGDNGTILTSDDNGLTWSAIASGTTNPLLGACTDGAGMHLVVGGSGLIRKTVDFSSWTTVPSGVTSQLNEVAYASGVYVAVGNSGVILTSSDGATWMRTGPGLDENYEWVGYQNGGFVVTGPRGTILVSNDGYHWALRHTGIGTRMNHATVFNGRMFAVGPSGTITSAALAPQVLVSPGNQIAAPGTDVEFRALLSATPAPVSYQWSKNGTPIAGATTATLLLKHVQLEDAGTYVLHAGNEFGTLPDITATLTVSGAPTLDALPASSAVIPGRPVTLSVTAGGGGVLTYQWRFNAMPISGASGSSYTIPSFNSSQAGSYDVVVSNGTGSATTPPVVLATAAADSTYVADSSFVRPVLDRPTTPARVTAAPNGQLYAAFSVVDSLTGMNNTRTGAIVRLNPDGTRDATFSVGTFLSSAWAMVPQADGKLIVGGSAALEENDSGQVRYRVFRLNSDGSLDTTFTSPAFASIPRYIVIQPGDGKLLVACSATNPAPEGEDLKLTRLNTDGSRDHLFMPPVFNSPDAMVFAPMTVDASGRILISGTFRSVNGVSVPGIARLLGDGRVDTSFVPSGFTTSSFPQMRGLAVQQLGANAGKILLAGGPITVGGVDKAIIRLNPDGSLDSSFTMMTQASAGMNPRPRMLELLSDDSFVIAGATVARFAPNGDPAAGYTRPTLSAETYWLEVLEDGTSYIPAEVGTQVNGAPAPSIVKISSSGVPDAAFNPGVFQTEVYDPSVQFDDASRPLVFGDFETVNGSVRPNAARFSPTGSLESFGFSGISDVLKVEETWSRSDGKILATVITGTTINDSIRSIRLFGADGALDSTFTLETTAATAVDFGTPVAFVAGDRVVLGKQSRDDVLAGSLFLQRLLPDGSLDGTFVGLGSTVFGAVHRDATNTVRQIVVGDFEVVAGYGDGRLLARAGHGPYTENAQTLGVTLVRLAADGSLDTTFTAPVLQVNTVRSYPANPMTDPLTGKTSQPEILSTNKDEEAFEGALILSDGHVLVGGNFVQLGGHATSGLARLNTDGSVDITFSTGSGPELRHRPDRQARVKHAALAPDGKIWVTGVFDTFNGWAAPGVVRLNADGSVDPTFAVEVGYRSYQSDQAEVMFDPLGRPWLVGSYATAADTFPYVLTRLVTDTPPAIVTQPDANQSVIAGGSLTLAVTVSGSPAPNVQWQRNGTMIPGASGASYTISNASQDDEGEYIAVVTSPTGAVETTPIRVAVVTSDLIVFSTRARLPVSGATKVTFTIEGSMSKTVLIRGAGPSLAALGEAGVLADPQLRLFNSAGTSLEANDDWGNAASFAEANAAGVAPVFNDGSKDAALKALLAPGTYTVVLDSCTGSGGLALLQVYDRDPSQPRIVMHTARANVGFGSEAAVIGFTIDGSLPKTVLIRAPGDALTAGIPVWHMLGDPSVAVYNSSNQLIGSNDDWDQVDSALVGATSRVGALPFMPYTSDAAILLTLDPGSYTVQLSDDSGTTGGDGLLEIFQVDAQRTANAAPVITYTSPNQTLPTDLEAVLSVNVVANPAATFQWRKDGVDVAGETSSSLRFWAVQPFHSGTYDVVVTNSAGSVTSPPMVLTVVSSYHSADSNQDFALDLVELTRVIQLYNTREGALRTGKYHSQADTEDGFTVGPGTITTHHSADANRDGAISLLELTRVIELFNYRDGTRRTGAYHPQEGTEDGFAPGPELAW